MDGNNDHLMLLIIAGIAVILLMVLTIILFVVYHQKKIVQARIQKQDLEIDYQRKMLKTALEAQENERKRMSKDLHDNVGMMLMTLRVNLNSESFESINQIRRLVDETNESVRRISWNLMPSTLDNFGLFQATLEMCERLSSVGTLVTQSENGDRVSLDKDQELLLYRITQEAVANSLRHAQASHVNIHYLWNSEILQLSISDDGLGFNFPTAKNNTLGRHGLGLFNLENRVALLGASFTFKKNNPTGTIVVVTLPLKHESN